MSAERAEVVEPPKQRDGRNDGGVAAPQQRLYAAQSARWSSYRTARDILD